ncbi:MAG: GNAT family N-acetyltransferase [Anaerolineaceae bacterium]|nr:GNAT family N-acetyltransferase [Anaerolineaceae bacterium]
MPVRRAEPEEASLLSDLALRSKAHWDYPASFIEACRDDLTVTPHDIAQHAVFVSIASGNQITGFYMLVRRSAAEADLSMLFIDPSAIGAGYGRLLFEHAVETARSGGYQHLFIDSDPFAESFYTRMGAVRIGEVESTVLAGRLLPLMRYDL